MYKEGEAKQETSLSPQPKPVSVTLCSQVAIWRACVCVKRVPEASTLSLSFRKRIILRMKSSYGATVQTYRGMYRVPHHCLVIPYNAPLTLRYPSRSRETRLARFPPSSTPSNAFCKHVRYTLSYITRISYLSCPPPPPYGDKYCEKRRLTTSCRRKSQFRVLRRRRRRERCFS